MNHPVIEKLVTKLRRTPDKAEQRALTKKVVDREFDQLRKGRVGGGQSRRSLAAVSPSMAAWSASVRPGVPRMWSTDVWVHGYG